MAAGDVRVLLNVDANDKVSAVIKETNVVMQRFGKNAKRSSKQATTGFARVTGTLKNAKTTFTELNSKVMLLQTAFAALRSIGEQAISGEIANNAEKIFTQVAGSSEKAQLAMQELRKSTMGIIDDTSLQVFASRLLIAGSQMKEVAGMAELAGKVALATGRQVPEVMQKLQDAILGGRQTEFRRLGTAIDMNKAIKEQIELEGRRVEDLEMSELITRRLALVTDKLTLAMDAAGINTAELSTHLRGLKADLDNLESTAQQTLANAISPEAIEERAGKVSKTIERVLKESGAAALTLLFNDGEAITKRFNDFSQQLAKETGLSVQQIQDDIKDAVLGAELATGERAGSGFFDLNAAITEGGKIEDLAESLAEQIIKSDRKRFSERQKAAQKTLEDEASAELEAGQKVIQMKGDIHALELFYFQSRSTMSKEDQVHLQSEIALEKLLLKLHQQKITQMDFELQKTKLLADTKDKLSKAEKPAKVKKIKTGKSADQIKAEQKAQNDAMMRAMVEGRRIERKLQIEAFREKKDLRIAQALELKDIDLKLQEDLMMNQDASFHQVDLMETKAHAERIRMIRSQADEILAIDAEQQRKTEELHQMHTERMKEMREEALREMQESALAVADALQMIQGPMIQFVDHEKGASQGMKAFGASMGAASAGAQVYANETDTAASTTDRLVQGLPAMSSAGGKAAAAFVKQTKTKALIQGGFESASAIAAFATGNIIGGAGHTAAAAAFFALAGKSGGKKGGASATSESALKTGGGGSGMTASTGGSSVVVNVQGFALGSSVDMGSAIGRTIDTARHTGLDSSEA
jgi:hypothetical protein